MEISAKLSDLSKELEKAYTQGLIFYYSLNRCVVSANVQYIDLHVTLYSENYHREEPLKKYLRERYGRLVRSISIETFTRN